MKNNYGWTFADMVRAFNNWRDMDRNDAYNFTAIKQAWDEYTAIRDAIGYKPFPDKMLIVKPKKEKSNDTDRDLDRDN